MGSQRGWRWLRRGWLVIAQKMSPLPARAKKISTPRSIEAGSGARANQSERTNAIAVARSMIATRPLSRSSKAARTPPSLRCGNCTASQPIFTASPPAEPGRKSVAKRPAKCSAVVRRSPMGRPTTCRQSHQRRRHASSVSPPASKPEPHPARVRRAPKTGTLRAHARILENPDQKGNGDRGLEHGEKAAEHRAGAGIHARRAGPQARCAFAKQPPRNAICARCHVPSPSPPHPRARCRRRWSAGPAGRAAATSGAGLRAWRCSGRGRRGRRGGTSFERTRSPCIPPCARTHRFSARSCAALPPRNPKSG